MAEDESYAFLGLIRHLEFQLCPVTEICWAEGMKQVSIFHEVSRLSLKMEHMPRVIHHMMRILPMWRSTYCGAIVPLLY